MFAKCSSKLVGASARHGVACIVSRGGENGLFTLSAIGFRDQ
jgi:hypothetical protein